MLVCLHFVRGGGGGGVYVCFVEMVHVMSRFVCSWLVVCTLGGGGGGGGSCLFCRAVTRFDPVSVCLVVCLHVGRCLSCRNCTRYDLVYVCLVGCLHVGRGGVFMFVL